eukprot:CAMPEP_0206530068 /NCGR_PEP_ID=MMETSP0325_2-20121206/2954_1 /ASSEMBLY_ACC=CAM_ASM_000347 /TAXON_ID=2866 /ORGANISM="Crypthecodinium cohnii, Strain Seligo" /LENGTH=290 /DNA_ID=CAMNT_0054026059 /DNA_START=104 /DNA_END=976 /DNA_ORIENTATION=-
MNGDYSATAEGKLWPFDTPITEQGYDVAREATKKIEEAHAKAAFRFILCSPYRRCLETASVVAKVLDLPVLLDEEIGEVWEEKMPSDMPPHRYNKELEEITNKLGLRILNATDSSSNSWRLGRRPVYPETIPQGHTRNLIHLDHVLETCAKLRMNIIICTHAPCVAAMANVFQRGGGDMKSLDYCATVFATRTYMPNTPITLKHGLYAYDWSVDTQGIATSLDLEATEEAHLSFCDSINDKVRARRASQAYDDKLLQELLQTLSRTLPRAKPKPNAPPAKLPADTDPSRV